MDLNCLFHQHQVSLMRAAAASSADTRRGHRADVDAARARIVTMQRDTGAIAWMRAGA